MTFKKERPRSIYSQVFGVGTVLKLVHGSSDAVGDQIVSHLLVNTAKSPKAGELRSFLQRSAPSDGSVSVGFLISVCIVICPLNHLLMSRDGSHSGTDSDSCCCTGSVHTFIC